MMNYRTLCCRALQGICTAISFLLALNTARAQTFVPDTKGYIADPAFHKIIKDRGYQLVGSFDTIRKKPLVIVADAVKDGKEVKIKTDGEIADLPVMPVPVRVSDIRGGADAGITIDAPAEDKTELFEQVYNNGKYGTRNKSTKQIGLPVIYDGMEWWGNGFLTIKKNGKTGVAQTNGTILLAPKNYDDVSIFNNYTEAKQRFYQVYNNKKIGLLDSHFKEIIAPQYDNIIDCYQCDVSDNLLIVSVDRKKGLLTKTGKELISPKYDNIMKLNNKAPYLLLIDSARKYGVTDTTGKVLIKPSFEHIKYLQDENLLELDNGFKQGTADLKGNIILQPIYEGVRKIGGGMRIVEQNRKDGLVGKDGKMIIQPEYDRLYYSDNHIFAKKDGKFGVLDLKGNVVIPLKYDDMGNGMKRIFFKEGNQFGIMNLSGKLLSKLDYENVEFANGFLIVTKNGKKGITDMDGKLLVPIKYDNFIKEYGFMRDGIAEASIGGKNCLVDLYGDELFR